MEVVRGASVTITNQNFSELSQVCGEFAFPGLADELSAFGSSPDFNDAHSAEGRICALEERTLRQELQIPALERIVTSETSKQERLAGALEGIRSTIAVQAETQGQTTEAVSADRAKLEELRRIVNSQVAKQDQTAQALTAALARLAHVEGELVRLGTAAAPTAQPTPPQAQAPTPATAPPVSPTPKSKPPPPSSPRKAQAPTPARAPPVSPPPPPLPRVDSLIVSDVPPLFDEFRLKKWTLLWRGSRDGFGAHDFHSRCDGHANTLTLIVTAASKEGAGGFVFGGFTPVEWDSRVIDWECYGSNCYKSDDSLKSFLFTLTNPRNIPARKFALMAEEKQKAIYCCSARGPSFGGMYVSDNCNANIDSVTYLGLNAYTNDTGLDGRTVFTGSYYFKVEEIEVFEITD
jgi:hypothetical protein